MAAQMFDYGPERTSGRHPSEVSESDVNVLSFMDSISASTQTDRPNEYMLFDGYFAPSDIVTGDVSSINDRSPSWPLKIVGSLRVVLSESCFRRNSHISVSRKGMCQCSSQLNKANQWN